MGGLVAGPAGSPRGSLISPVLPVPANTFMTLLPLAQVLRHPVSRNILWRCENLLFNFFPLKGRKNP